MTLDDLDRLTPLVRELVLARYDEQQARCGRCGSPISECSDPELEWFPQLSVCYKTMALAEANRQFDEAHEGLWHDGLRQTWLPKRTPLTPMEPRDGVLIWLSSMDHSPDDDFLTRPKAAIPSAGSEAE